MYPQVCVSFNNFSATSVHFLFRNCTVANTAAKHLKSYSYLNYFLSIVPFNKFLLRRAGENVIVTRIRQNINKKIRVIER